MSGRVKLVAVVALACAAIPGSARAQTLTNTSAAYYGTGTGTTLMASLGFSSICEFYYFVTIGTTGSFPLSILTSHFPQCLGWTPPSLEGGEGSSGEGGGPVAEEETDGTGGTNGSGNTGGSSETDGTGDDEGDGTGDPAGEEWEEVPPPEPQPDWTNGGSSTVTPEPMSLLLLGTGLAGLGGVRLARRRKAD